MTETKRCTRCGTEKALSDFGAKQARCRECRSEVARQSRQKETFEQREARLERAARYRHRNRDKLRKKDKQWKQDNREKVRRQQDRANYRRWIEELATLETELARSLDEFSKRPEFEREIVQWEHKRSTERLQGRISELRKWLAELGAKGITGEVAAVQENSPARLKEQRLEELTNRLMAEYEEERRANPTPYRFENDLLLWLALADFLPEQQHLNEQAHEDAHRVAKTVAGRCRGDKARAYREAYSKAYQPLSVEDATLFQWPKDWLADPHGTLRRLEAERDEKKRRKQEEQDEIIRRYKAKMGRHLG